MKEKILSSLIILTIFSLVIWEASLFVVVSAESPTANAAILRNYFKDKTFSAPSNGWITEIKRMPERIIEFHAHFILLPATLLSSISMLYHIDSLD